MGELNVKILIQTLEEEANSQCGDTSTFPHNISTEFSDYTNSTKWWLGNVRLSTPSWKLPKLQKYNSLLDRLLPTLLLKSILLHFLIHLLGGGYMCCGTDFGVTWPFAGISFPSTMRVLFHLCLMCQLIGPVHYHLKTDTWHISCLTTGERNTAGRGQKEYKQASLVSLPPFKFYLLCAQPFLTQLTMCGKKSKLKNSRFTWEFRYIFILWDFCVHKIWVN